MVFTDRIEAGRRLAALLESRLRADGAQAGRELVVLGLPRGGVPVAAEVAAVLQAPLDVLVVRKLGVPFQPELAFGAIGELGVRVINDSVVRSLHLAERDIAQVEAREHEELERRLSRYRVGRPALDLHGRTVVVVDDGVATGSTARAACLVVRARGAARVILAVPVAPHGWTHRLRDVADDLVCLENPRSFFAIGEFYDDFAATTDEEVRERLRGTPLPADPEIVLPVRGGNLVGRLVTPAESAGIVLFAHGSGSGRGSPRNRRVAEVLNRRGVATLLLDLLTDDEARDRANVFHVALLADRLRSAADWAQEWLRGLPVGYFGASTGAAAALHAAADPADPVRAIVCRGGRPDLAAARLADVTAPTLLIVGGRDDMVLDLNRRAEAELRCESRLDVVPGATHLFEEPGALDAVAQSAAAWFTAHFRDGGEPDAAHVAGPRRGAAPR